MKTNYIFAVIVAGFLTGCATTSQTSEAKAADVPNLTKVMHVYARRQHYPCLSNLPPAEVQILYGQAIAMNPALDEFNDDVKSVRWCSGDIILLLSDPETGAARFEDASWTPNLDRRWYETNCPPHTFTISHPETCGCEGTCTK